MKRKVTWEDHGTWAEIWIDGIYVGTVEGVTVCGRITGQASFFYAADFHHGRAVESPKLALKSLVAYHERWIKKPVVKRAVRTEYGFLHQTV